MSASIPKRRFTIQVEVGGDTMQAAVDLLNELTDGHFGNRVIGGCHAGGHIRVIENPDMTHDKYFAAIKEQRTATEQESPQ